jgi:cytochrome c5
MKKTVMSVGIIACMGFTGICFAEKAPAVNGAELLEKKCSTCHPSARAKGLKKTAAEWETTVKRMISKGVKLADAEKKALVEYLAKTYKP